MGNIDTEEKKIPDPIHILIITQDEELPKILDPFKEMYSYLHLHYFKTVKESFIFLETRPVIHLFIYNYFQCFSRGAVLYNFVKRFYSKIPVIICANNLPKEVVDLYQYTKRKQLDMYFPRPVVPEKLLAKLIRLFPILRTEKTEIPEESEETDESSD